MPEYEISFIIEQTQMISAESINAARDKGKQTCEDMLKKKRQDLRACKLHSVRLAGVEHPEAPPPKDVA
jgi:hypothetical protein